MPRIGYGCMAVGDAHRKTKCADDGEGSASNEQNVKGEYKAAQAIQHDTFQRCWNANDAFAVWFLSQ